MAFRRFEAVEHQFRKREEEFVKMVDEAKEKVLEEIRTKADAKRHRDLEDTLEDFMARVKRQAQMATAFPNISQSSHLPRRMTDISQDLAATSREAARSLMSVVVRNEETRNPPGPVAVDSQVKPSQNNVRVDVGVGALARGKELVVPVRVDEPEDKPMIEDRKGKGPAVDLVYRRCTRQKTMHEVLGACSSRDQVVPTLVQGVGAIMTEAAVPDALDLPNDHEGHIATITPIGNKRLALPEVGLTE